MEDLSQPPLNLGIAPWLGSYQQNISQGYVYTPQFWPEMFSIPYLPSSEKAMAPHSSSLAWKNPMDGGAWWAAVHGVAKSRTQLNNFTFTFHFHALEKEMPAHSSVLAWSIPGMGEPGELWSLGLHRVRHDWSNLAAAAAAAGRKWWQLKQLP